ncbi:MAG: hypothetical protein M1837_007055 [Sclerophora amabilis]|nr:MAG: hypothetical protein M1837_007055 [Sclerophora amabilis]
MSASESLEEIRDLYHDLVAFSESHLPTVERLAAQLEAKVDDFRHLLDKPAKNEKSRQSLLSGKIHVDDQDYTINEECKQTTIQLADGLDLDELEAARLFIAFQNDPENLARAPLENCVIRFHERRLFLLESLRLVLKKGTDPDNDPNHADFFRTIVMAILDSKPSSNQRTYTQKCLSAMADIKKWLRSVGERVQNASILGSTETGNFAEIMDFQKTSLLRQHESLGTILSYVVTASEAKTEDFQSFLAIVKAIDKFDDLMVHYVPPLLTFISHFGNVEAAYSYSIAKSFHEKIVDNKDDSQWSLQYFHSASIVWWLAEYSTWYVDSPNDPAIAALDLEAESEARTELFFDALRNGAFDFILSLSFEVKRADWIDPVRTSLRRWLLQDKNKVPDMIKDSTPFSDSFQVLLMERLEIFVDRFITNMPGLLRRLRTDEDQQRLLNLEKQSSQRYDIDPHQHNLDLEKFVVAISYIFEHRVEAAETFWEDPENTLFGFLQWIGRRLSTPRACAVSELVLSLSEGEECASAAHKFLLEEGSGFGSKSRRTYSLNWEQILYETQYFVSKIRDVPVVPQSSAYSKGRDRTDRTGPEPETDKMLESYLRLITRLCHNSLEARSWVLNHPSCRIVELLFSLAGSSVPGPLRACAFEALAALLNQKTREIGENVWLALDNWIAGGSLPSVALAKPGSTAVTPQWKEEVIFDNLGFGFEEPTAFIVLLHALVTSYPSDDGLNDVLTFPEHLGTSHRSAGITPYVDFALGRIFATKTAEIQDIVQLRVLRLTCLEFIKTCLSTFNEDLVIFANRCNVSVDSAMRATSLISYARLHPFARVMEWLFNDRVQDALFATAHQDQHEVSIASSDSPLIIALHHSIEVMNMIFRLQATYLDILRPMIKTSTSGRPKTVANATLASFEDAILNNLQLAVDLGHYCGTGHQELTLASIRLLERISTSRKLITSSRDGGLDERNKIIGVLVMNGESDRIAQTFIDAMQLNVREISYGPESPGYIVKCNILKLLNNCLSTTPNQPSVAHLLLGFTCRGHMVEISSGGLFSKGVSLFHSILELVTEYPSGEDGNNIKWMFDIKLAALEVLKKLWKSPLTSVYTMTELRANDFLFDRIIKQPLLDSTSLFDGRPVTDDDFFLTHSADCFASMLRQRASFLDYTAAEIRMVSVEQSPTLMRRIISALLGETTTPDGDSITNPSVLDLFDFMEMNIPEEFRRPELQLLNNLDFSICLKGSEDETADLDLHGAEQLVTLRSNELRKYGQLSNPDKELTLQVETTHLLGYAIADNYRRRLVIFRLQTLKAWVHLLSVIVQDCNFDRESKTAFILQTLQLILPKLEKQSLDNVTEALEIARLAKTLLFNLDFVESSLGKGRAGDMANDRLFQLFRISLHSIHSPAATSQLREIFYSICYRYLTAMSDVPSTSTFIRRHSIQTIKASGERLIDVICDDAYAAEGASRISALLLLDALVSLGQQENSKYIIESFTRLNFISLLVDAIKHMPSEIRDTNAQHVSLLLSYYATKLSLLQRISQTRHGSGCVLNAGLFQAIHESGLFAVDPDLGIDIDNSDALKKYYELLLAVIRIINTAVLSRAQHEQTIDQARKFVSKNRYSMVAVFKRHARIGGARTDMTGDLEELVENFVLLISMTGFLEFEEESSLKSSASKLFT